MCLATNNLGKLKIPSKCSLHVQPYRKP
uniref:Uncharacterized protein n=1 Tax=Rhizophora mucronata TaxID=61149 RepID=A0A2P2ND59_RHIMU